MRHLLILLSVGLIIGCAQVVAPTGGEKDTTPPVLLMSTPANFTTDFKEKEVRFTFDEYITLKNVNASLVVSPPLPEQPEIRLKKKSVIMKMPDSLANNTTYVFDFGNGIADLNEGNAVNLVYVFSTGSQIDSLKIKGSAIDAYTKKPIENASVLLYRNYVDTLPRTTRPNFFARTDKKGAFTVSYLKADDYGIVVLNDANASLTYDSPSEGIAFLDNTISLQNDSAVSLLPMSVFVEDKMPVKITDRKRIKPTEYKLGLSKKLEFVTVRSIQSDVREVFTKLSISQDSLFIWVTNEPADSITFIVETNQSPVDTITFFIRNGEKAKPLTKIKAISPAAFIGKHENYTLQFNQPIHMGDLSKLTLLSDSQIVESQWNMTNENAFELTGIANWKNDGTYQLVLDSGAVLSRNGVSMDSTSIHFSVKPPDYYGILFLNIVFEKPASYVLTLLSEKGELVSKQVIEGDKELVFRNMNPGKYTCHIIEDTNGDGKWTTGDFDEKRQPEKIYYLKQELKIRSNWDLKIDWNVNSK